MKLSSEQIGTIEALLTLREKGISNTEIGRRLELGDFGQQKVSGAFAVLDAMGLPVPAAKRGRPFGCRKPRSKAPRVTARTGGRQTRVFLSAAQWEERLASYGH